MMKPLGELERRVMEILWASEGAVPAPDIAAHLPNHAYTTIMTILHRLGKKGYVTRVRVGRSYSYAASESLASFSAKTMHDTLELAHDRAAVLAAFVALGTHEDRAQLSLALEHASQQQQP
jgi:predicted transcriptional regulator